MVNFQGQPMLQLYKLKIFSQKRQRFLRQFPCMSYGCVTHHIVPVLLKKHYVVYFLVMVSRFIYNFIITLIITCISGKAKINILQSRVCINALGGQYFPRGCWAAKTVQCISRVGTNRRGGVRFAYCIFSYADKEQILNIFYFHLLPLNISMK